MNYQEFLKSKQWKSYKEMALIIFDSRCHFCESTHSLELHHTKYTKNNTYKILSSTKPSKRNFRWFLLLCRSCHQAIHNIQKKEGLTVYKATKKYKRKFFDHKNMWVYKKQIRRKLPEPKKEKILVGKYYI